MCINLLCGFAYKPLNLYKSTFYLKLSFSYRILTYLVCALLVIALPSSVYMPEASHVGSKSYFGILVSVSTVGYDMTYAVITEESNGTKSHRHITRVDFVHIAQGKWKMRPNMQQENLFDKYGIEWGYNERNQLHCPVLDTLWKIRYRELPHKRGVTGWANDAYMPSPAQQIYLFDNFGVYNINTNFFEGENVWKLLQAVSSDEWKAMYKSL